ETDYIRLACRDVAKRQSEHATRTEVEALSRSAEQATDERPEGQLALAHLASKWKLEPEAEQLWLRIAKNPPMRREALDALARLYRTKNETGKLYDILQRLHES